MDPRATGFLALCIAAVLLGGCVTQNAEPAGTVPSPSSTIPATPAAAASPSSPAAIAHRTAMTVTASPQVYSPMMSSTPGIGLEPDVTGFSAENASFAWTATYGEFLSWDSPGFRVNPLGGSATNHGEKIYWSFYERPASTESPVTITVTATDPASGQILGNSTVTLAWVGNYSVAVRGME